MNSLRHRQFFSSRRAQSGKWLWRLAMMIAACLAGMSIGFQAEGIRADTLPGQVNVVRSPHLYTRVEVHPVYEAPQDAGTPMYVTHQGQQHVFRVHDGGAGSSPRPVVLLLHGANRDGRSMIDTWKAVADQHGFLLMAPDAQGSSWQPRIDSPAAFDAMIQRLARDIPIDPNRLFLFGHSAGAVYAQILANRLPRPWKAVSTHGGAVDADAIVKAENAPPIQIILGTRDALFPLTSAKETAAHLAQAGHAVEFVEIPEHTHWYYATAPDINAAAAAFFLEQ